MNLTPPMRSCPRRPDGSPHADTLRFAAVYHYLSASLSVRGSASSFPRRSVVIATRRVRPPGAAWNYSAPWTSRSTGGATHRQSQGTSSKTIARNILLWTPKCDWSEDLTTEFILLRGSRLQILAS